MLANYKKDLDLPLGFKAPSDIQEEARAKAAGWEGLEQWNANAKAEWNRNIDREL